MANNEETIVLGPGNNNNQNKNVPPRPSVAPQPKAQARPQQPMRPTYQPQNDDQTWKRVAIGGVAGIMFGTIFAALLGFVIEFFAHGLDYRQNENLQFEDEEYYYYVKAVPKFGSEKRRRPASSNSSSTSSSKTVRTANGVRRTT